MVRDVCLLALEGVYQECQRVTIKWVCIKRVRGCIKRVRVGVYVKPDMIQIIHQHGYGKGCMFVGLRGCVSRVSEGDY